jgi:imidazolonepropionase-like amidohydrolase
MLIDAHAHIDQYKDDLPEAIAQIENEPILMPSNSKFLSTSVK